jgi:hypothetical protein
MNSKSEIIAHAEKIDFQQSEVRNEEMIKGLWILMLLVVGGCRSQAMNDELANKPEYSVLQAYEYQYRVSKTTNLTWCSKCFENRCNCSGLPDQEQDNWIRSNASGNEDCAEGESYARRGFCCQPTCIYRGAISNASLERG